MVVAVVRVNRAPRPCPCNPRRTARRGRPRRASLRVPKPAVPLRRPPRAPRGSATTRRRARGASLGSPPIPHPPDPPRMVRLPSRGTRRVGSAPPPAPPRWTRRPLWLAPAGPPVALSARSPTPTGASGRPIHGGTGGGGGGKRKTVAAAAGGSTDARTRAAPRAGGQTAADGGHPCVADRRAGGCGRRDAGSTVARTPANRADGYVGATEIHPPQGAAQRSADPAEADRCVDPGRTHLVFGTCLHPGEWEWTDVEATSISCGDAIGSAARSA